LEQESQFGSSATILLVEDEAFVRNAAAEVLAAAGYRVIVARDSAEALPRCSISMEPIDLLLTDLILPGVSGRELARTFAQSHPAGHVLLMSGHADPLAGAPLLSDPIDLPKPFSSASLLQKIEEILGPSRVPISATLELRVQSNA
jgi:two-component system, cell cycle sensor histidine kinase and response regulator CckA